MLSSSALKYNIAVNSSFYGAVFVFTLYFALILLSLLIVGLSWLTVPFLILLLIVAVYGGKKNYAQRYNLQLSDSGLVEFVSKNGDLISAKIGSSSFYNGFFLSLHLQNNPADLANLIDRKKVSNSFIVIYRDAVSEQEYRLLARLINSGRD